ncbi:hypothetical protein Salat_0145100 [Sesamum alatum]|uniref:Uncharacterized protein n=1 Tax=Sesamum alatum TaxID=300844 RepID=A0AAE2CXJ8_9LAMI|nr:hypothetical protein Salat_0145100 [Sesamum alatum]
MAQNQHPLTVLPFLLIALASTSSHVIMADARNLLELNLPELPLPELPDLTDLPGLPESELPSLPKVELPDFPALPDLNVPTLPKIAGLPSFPQFPEVSKPGASAIHKDSPQPSTVSSTTSP